MKTIMVMKKGMFMKTTPMKAHKAVKTKVKAMKTVKKPKGQGLRAAPMKVIKVKAMRVMKAQILIKKKDKSSKITSTKRGKMKKIREYEKDKGITLSPFLRKTYCDFYNDLF
jgi:hypothetical protein